MSGNAFRTGVFIATTIGVYAEIVKKETLTMIRFCSYPAHEVEGFIAGILTAMTVRREHEKKNRVVFQTIVYGSR